MRVFVTGIAGFVGRHLARHLLDEGDEVFGTVRPDTDVAEARAALPECRLVDVDIRDADRIRAAIADAGPDAIYHLAALANPAEGEKQIYSLADSNVSGTYILLDAVRHASPGARFLFVSSGAVYGAGPGDGRPIREDDPPRPATRYAMTKLCGELMTRAFAETWGLDAVVVRPFNHTGPGQDAAYVTSSFARQAAAIRLGQQPPRIEVGDIDLVRDFTDVRDVVRAYRRLVVVGGGRGEIYNVCSGVGYRIGAILDVLQSLVGARFDIIADAARRRPDVAPTIVGSSIRVRDHTGWAARIPMETTIRDLFDAWADRLSATPLTEN